MPKSHSSSSDGAASRPVRIADAATIAYRFTDPAWLDPKSASYLTRAFTEGSVTRVAGETRPAADIAVKIEQALHDYTETLSPEVPTRIKNAIVAALERRKGRIAEMLGADRESVETVKELIAPEQGIGQDAPPASGSDRGSRTSDSQKPNLSL